MIVTVLLLSDVINLWKVIENRFLNQVVIKRMLHGRYQKKQQKSHLFILSDMVVDIDRSQETCILAINMCRKSTIGI